MNDPCGPADPMSEEKREDVLGERERAQQDYLLTQAIYKKEEEFKGEETITSSSR